MDMGIEFFRHGRVVLVEMDLVAALGLDGVLADARPHLDTPEVRRVGADVDAAYRGPVELDPVGVDAWLRGLVAVHAHLARTLAVDALPRAEVAVLIGQLAAGSPVATAARAFLFTGAVITELAELELPA